ncbi:MAG: hypothetical protein GJT30_03475 [Geobacter sp.]|nr:hypothetical protein [Geobacter sp.]
MQDSLVLRNIYLISSGLGILWWFAWMIFRFKYIFDEPLLTVLTLLPVFILLFVSKWSSRRATQIEIKTLRSNAENDTRPALIMLRPFKDEGLSFPISTMTGKGGKYRRASFISDIADVAKQCGFPLLVIGRPMAKPDLEELTRAVYFQAKDDSWVFAFRRAALASRAIILIPSDSTGVAEEMLHLSINELTSKTIVFMPPTPVETRVEKCLGPNFDPERVKDEWNKVRDHWKRQGFNLPLYCKDGMLYIPNNDFSCRCEMPLAGTYSLAGEFLANLLHPSISHLLTKIYGDCMPISCLLSEISTYEDSKQEKGARFEWR